MSSPAGDRPLAQLDRRKLTVCENSSIGPYRLLSLEDSTGAQPVAGQFAMLAAATRWGGGEDERPFLPRAFSYTRRRAGRADFLFHDVGPGTRRLAELSPGEEVWALGPLGRPFTVPAGAPRPVLVGGGVGIAPLVMLSEALAGSPAAQPPLALLGFRDAHHAACAELIGPARLATDDGSAGHGGSVVDLLREELGRDRNCRVYACGPLGMLEAVRALCVERGVAAELALETPMACGFGACHGCAVRVRGGGYLRACLDGPVFDAALLEALGELPDRATHCPAEDAAQPSAGNAPGHAQSPVGALP
ncbi:MAG: dihydroorotate dehydrogenase electron transfer subunit [Solirubrobacteraceae bacterium]